MTIEKFKELLDSMGITDDTEIKYYNEDLYYDIDSDYFPVTEFTYNKEKGELILY